MQKERIKTFSRNGLMFSVLPTHMVCDIAPHSHDYIEIVIFQQGAARHNLETVSGEKSSCTVIQGDCFAILPGEIHSFTEGRSAIYYNLIVSRSFLGGEAAKLKKLPGWKCLFEQRSAEASRIRLEPLERTFFDECLQQLIRELNLQRSGYQICARVYLLNLLVTLLRSTPGKPAQNLGGIAEKGVLAVIGDMEKNPERHYTLESLARKAGMCVAGFTRAMRLVTGCSSREYLSTLRIQKAAGLLLETQKGLKEIADECGFCDQNYLIKCFRSHYGTTPLKFRNDSFVHHAP